VTEREETLFAFPCDFPVKAMGKAGEDFELLVLDIVRRHAPDLDDARVKLRESRGGKWVSVTVTIQAQSKDQLDAIYRDLSGHERVVWAM
jgi:putative lipoic acid-binding regulatory protein